MRTITVDAAPRVVPLLVKAVVTAPGRGGALPDTAVIREGVLVDRAQLAAYDRVCGYDLRDRLPSTYLHVLTFGLQTTLMAQRGFPLPLPGLVHVANSLVLRRPVEAGEKLGLTVQAEGLRPHARGAQVDLVAQVRVGAELVWTGRSTYLARGASVPDQAARPTHPVPAPVTDGPPQARWSIARDAGRRYASVSGDVNPIHLSPWPAKAFGFPRAIAHGMWTTARCLSALEPHVPAAHEVRVEFKRPVLLPSQVELRTRRAGDTWSFALSAARGGAEHLRGVVLPLP